MTQVSSNQSNTQIAVAIKPYRHRAGEQATNSVTEQDRPDQGIGHKHLGEARLLAGQGQQCEEDMDDGNGEDSPVPPTGAERLLGARERPGENQDRREFEGQDNGEHQDAPMALRGLNGVSMLNASRSMSAGEVGWNLAKHHRNGESSQKQARCDEQDQREDLFVFPACRPSTPRHGREVL